MVDMHESDVNKLVESVIWALESTDMDVESSSNSRCIDASSLHPNGSHVESASLVKDILPAHTDDVVQNAIGMSTESRLLTSDCVLPAAATSSGRDVVCSEDVGADGARKKSRCRKNRPLLEMSDQKTMTGSTRKRETRGVCHVEPMQRYTKRTKSEKRNELSELRAGSSQERDGSCVTSVQQTTYLESCVVHTPAVPHGGHVTDVQSSSKSNNNEIPLGDRAGSDEGSLVTLHRDGKLQPASEFELSSPVGDFFDQRTAEKAAKERVIVSSAASSMVDMHESDVNKLVESVIWALESTDMDVESSSNSRCIDASSLHPNGSHVESASLVKDILPAHTDDVVQNAIGMSTESRLLTSDCVLPAAATSSGRDVVCSEDVGADGARKKSRCRKNRPLLEMSDQKTMTGSTRKRETRGVCHVEPMQRYTKRTKSEKRNELSELRAGSSQERDGSCVTSVQQTTYLESCVVHTPAVPHGGHVTDVQSSSKSNNNEIPLGDRAGSDEGSLVTLHREGTLQAGSLGKKRPGFENVATKKCSPDCEGKRISVSCAESNDLFSGMSLTKQQFVCNSSSESDDELGSLPIVSRKGLDKRCKAVKNQVGTHSADSATSSECSFTEDSGSDYVPSESCSSTDESDSCNDDAEISTSDGRSVRDKSSSHRITNKGKRKSTISQPVTCSVSSTSKSMPLVSMECRQHVNSSTDDGRPAAVQEGVGNADDSDENQNNEAECVTNVTVLTTNNANGIRKRDKRAYCFFCGTAQTHILRHWFARHGEEREVQHIKCAGKDRRVIEITRLRNMGNHIHNCNVLRSGEGDLVVTYRPTNHTDFGNYVPCDTCYAYIHKRELWRHRCKLRAKTKGRVAANAALLLPAPSGISAVVHRLINGMLDPEIKLIIRNDEIINCYTEKMVHKHSMSKRSYIRSQVTMLCRFLKEMRKRGSTITMKDCIRPSQFQNVVQAVKSVAGYSEESGLYKTPSTALKIGHMLKKCAKLVKTRAIMAKQTDVIEDANFFHELCDSEWADEVSSRALKTIVTNRRNKIRLLPLSDDVALLHRYLNEEITRLVPCLEKAVAENDSRANLERIWKQLASATLAQLITFNRRRSGEVSRMALIDFRSRTRSDMGTDAQKALEPMEQGLCKLFTRVEVEGKRGRTVPILLRKETESALQLMEHTRQVCGIKADNPYVFAMSNSDNYLRGNDSIRIAANSCGAKQPFALQSTNLRKHVATLCQMINMKENELDLLAQYMGHDITVHRNFYRLPNDTLQSATLAKLFLAMEEGTLVAQKGKTLQDLMVQLPSEDLSECNKLVFKFWRAVSWKVQSFLINTCVGCLPSKCVND
jgi:hypothetical protein